MKNRLTGLSMKQIFAIIVVVIVAILLGVWLSFRSFTPPQTEASDYTLYSPAADITPFQLTDSNGRKFTNLSLQGHWTFIYFGYTNCVSICPTTMQLLNNVYQKLLQQARNQMPAVIMVTVDPDNDTPKRMHDYVTAFNLHFQGVTGTKEQIQQLASTLNIVYTKVKTNGGFTFDHTGMILLIDPSGRLTAAFSPPLNANNIAQDYQNIVNSSG